MVKLEICSADIESVLAAAEGGADRVELCSGLEIGGVTPSEGLIRQAVETARRGGPKVNVLIRPRGGDFVYTDAEKRVMEADIEAACRLGVNGVVVGALLPDGSIDVAATRRLVEAARRGGAEVTFHRAFDRAANLAEALEQLVALGCDRVLTSGGCPTAREGADTLAALVRQARGRIAVMAGAGVTSDNVAALLAATGCPEVHASAKTVRPSAAVAADPALRDAAEGSCFVTWAPEVAAIKTRIMNNEQ